jgi:hypothetical protein
MPGKEAETVRVTAALASAATATLSRCGEGLLEAVLIHSTAPEKVPV